MTAIDTSTWTDAQKAEFAALEDSISEESSKTELAEAKREAERLNPVNILAERKAELEEKKKSATLAAAELEADKVFRSAVATYGKSRAARIFTEEGSIIMRAMTLAEWDDFSVRVEAVTEAIDKIVISREAVASVVLYPVLPLFNTTVSRWPGLWHFLFMARDAMIAGIKEDTAKKG